jgi:hypothetical protein
MKHKNKKRVDLLDSLWLWVWLFFFILMLVG